MSGPTFVVLPATGDSMPRTQDETSEIASTIQRALQERQHPTQAGPGPIKQMLAHQDSLYRYINWEDPLRTLGCYVGALSILLGAHYLPLTQLFLKAGVTTLGAISAAEFASRMLSEDSLSARLRPKEYKKFPESTLNATLKDIHDLSQYAIVQVQRVVFGQDLDKTFAAFLIGAALYVLAMFINPFGLAIIALTSVFAAPLAHSAYGRQIANNAQGLASVAVNKGQQLAQTTVVKGQELAHTTVEKGQELAQNTVDRGQELAQNGQAKAAQLSSQTRDAATNLAQNGQAKAAQLSSQTRDAASNIAQTGQAKASQLSSQTRDAASNAAQNGQAKAAQLSSQTRDAASNVSGSIGQGVNNMQQATSGTNNGYGRESYPSHQSSGGYAATSPTYVERKQVVAVDQPTRAIIGTVAAAEHDIHGAETQRSFQPSRNNPFTN